jgi:hypothetical protein
MARNRINIVPDKGLRIALIQKSQGPAWEGCVKVGLCKPSQIQPHLMLEEEVIETRQGWRKQQECSLLIQDVTQQNQRPTEWEQCVQTLRILIYHNRMLCMCSVSMCDCCICFKRINHMVLHYMHWSSVHNRERLAVVSQTSISIKQPKRRRRSVGMNKGRSCMEQEYCSSMRGSTLATAGNSMGGREPVGGYIWQVQCKTMVPGPGKVATGQLIWWEAKCFCHNFSTSLHSSHPAPSNYIRVALRTLSSFQGEIKKEFLLLTYLLYYFRDSSVWE